MRLMKPTCFRLARGCFDTAIIAAALLATLAARSASATASRIESSQASDSSDQQELGRASLVPPSRLLVEPKVAEHSLDWQLDASKPTEKCLPSPLFTKVVDPSTYEIGCDEIQELLQGRKRLIGHGYVRDVYVVKYKGRRVVIKTLRVHPKSESERQHYDSMHRREEAALHAVRGHPQVVNMLGVCNTTSSVTEFIGNNVEMFLERSAGRARDISVALPMALDAARGLQVLHEAPGGPIVHCDLKPENVLIDKQGALKINDLNQCQFMATDEDGQPCPFKGPENVNRRGWHSPESMAGKVLTEKVDIYNMGMILYVVISGRLPFGLKSGLGHTEGRKPFVDPAWHSGFMEGAFEEPNKTLCNVVLSPRENLKEMEKAHIRATCIRVCPKDPAA